MSPDQSGAVESIYRALGLRVPLEGIPDNQQKCQVLGCYYLATRTQFFQHKTVDFPLRLWLCNKHADSIMRPKPIAVRALFPNMHLESIPMAHREAMKDSLTAQIQAYCLEQFVRPRGEIHWTWAWVEGFKDDNGNPIQGMELLGQVEIERVELGVH